MGVVADTCCTLTVSQQQGWSDARFHACCLLLQLNTSCMTAAFDVGGARFGLPQSGQVPACCRYNSAAPVAEQQQLDMLLVDRTRLWRQIWCSFGCLTDANMDFQQLW
jgi:hypothetical protein